MRDDSAAFARNWRTILIVDAAIGAVVLFVGVAVAGIIGSIMVGAGAAYLFLGLRRARRWQRLRAEQGLV